MVQKLDLDEREHAFSILLQLDQMKRDQRHCDFIVSVDGDDFHAHRNILSAGSDYFNAMLTHDTKESQLGKVEMMGVDSECVGICLIYIYTGKAEVPEGKTEQLIGVAALLQLDKLCNAVSKLLQKSLATNTFYSTRRIAEMYDLQDLSAACTIFEQGNILLLSSQGYFRNEQENHVAEMLTSVLLTEQEKLIISLRWVGGFSERKRNLFDFLKYINFEKIPEDYLHNILQNYPLINSDLELYKIFSVGLVQKLKVGSFDSNGGKSLVLFDETHNSLRHFDLRTNGVEEFHEEIFSDFQEFSAIALHSYIYILTEERSVHRLRFEEKKAKWERMQDMIEYHGSCPPSVSLNDCLYVIAGNCEQITSAAEKFCPGKNRWIKLKEKPIATDGAALVALGGFIYSLGGETKRGKSIEKPSNAFHKFNSQSGQWTELQPLRQAKYSCGAIAVYQKIYIFGGEVNGAVVNDMDCYDVTVEQWTRLSPMTGFHALINAHHVCGCIFAVERMANSNTIEKYDIKRNEWQKVKLNVSDEFEIYDSILI